MSVDAQLGRLREQLFQQARLFDDPATYQAGVEDALSAVRRLLDRQRRPAARTTILVPELAGTMAAVTDID